MTMVASQFLMRFLDQECAHKLLTWNQTWITLMLFYFIYKKEIEAMKFIHLYNQT